jgi:Secretion system C-terminal sorting domain
MKKIRQPVDVLRKSLAIAFLLSFFILTAKAQNATAGFNATGVGAVNTLDDNASLHVYPNPAADEEKLVFNSSNYGTRYQIRIINNSGIQLQNMEGTTVLGQNITRFHVGNYPPGIYYIQLLTSSGRETLKLLKQPFNSL